MAHYCKYTTAKFATIRRGMVAEVDLFYTPKKELPLSYVG